MLSHCNENYISKHENIRLTHLMAKYFISMKPTTEICKPWTMQEPVWAHFIQSTMIELPIAIYSNRFSFWNLFPIQFLSIKLYWCEIEIP